MKDFAGKVAVVTGGASGIGRATGQMLAELGMKVVLADIERPALADAVTAMREQSLDVTGIPTDLTQWESVKATADEAVRTYGKVNVAFLNAGVASGGRGNMWDVDLNDWAWGIAVNVWGVIHGIKAFLPIMTAQDEEGHCVITSSSVGVIAPTPSGGVYAMTKAAGLSLAEVLYGQLRAQGSKVSASVLVPPGTINTGLFTSARNRQAEYAPLEPREEAPTLTYAQMLERMNASGNPRRSIEPTEVAEYVVEGIRDDTFWILPGDRHPDIRDNFDALARARSQSLLNRGDPLEYLQKPT
ncbi:MAG TPA: SDR family NAD(P)-dependent oxidoreductase [Acidimicrobiales bacterium]|nr:SDR family NAD(P)-dependent oxidoreductase [Acidimicrobiales bacterium]